MTESPFQVWLLNVQFMNCDSQILLCQQEHHELLFLFAFQSFDKRKSTKIKNLKELISSSGWTVFGQNPCYPDRCIFTSAFASVLTLLNNDNNCTAHVADKSSFQSHTKSTDTELNFPWWWITTKNVGNWGGIDTKRNCSLDQCAFRNVILPSIPDIKLARIG